MAFRMMTGLVFLLSLVAGWGCQQDLRASLADEAPSERWIYDDWGRAQSEAAKTGKPIFVVFRCVP